MTCDICETPRLIQRSHAIVIPTVRIFRRRLLRTGAVAVVSWVTKPVAAWCREEKSDDPVNRASVVTNALFMRHWDEGGGLFHSKCPVPPEPRFDYWWQAHALDLLVDAYERTSARIWLDRGGKLLTGIIRKNGRLINDYYDDMLWLALAVQRLNAHEKKERLAGVVDRLWKDILTGRNDRHGGGIAWRKQQRDYKSVPSNAPAVILGARLHRQSGDREALQVAHEVFRWLDEILVDPESGLLWDGINRRGDGRIDRRWVFSYNQGTYIGAALELYQVTGEVAFLQKARRTARAAMKHLTDANGILRESGLGDGGLFKGVFVRYLAELARADEDSFLDCSGFLKRQADALWKHAQPQEDPTFPASWVGLGDRGRDELAVQLSAAILFEKVATLDREVSRQKED